ncbi:unnamed protein product [Heligmosomoides polygyrus]|uniref:Reverse transcriptase domain-containing protein n=1 Tax=Heligmosomoides polygyrus TaxID=6339 RepID=A0A183FPW3_HELPZ|nr:unnamed protein product [Heligmosomoides polygyrus]
MLASEDKGELERELQAWCDRLERFGLRLNVKKTEYLTTDVRCCAGRQDAGSGKVASWHQNSGPRYEAGQTLKKEKKKKKKKDI